MSQKVGDVDNTKLIQQLTVARAQMQGLAADAQVTAKQVVAGFKQQEQAAQGWLDGIKAGWVEFHQQATQDLKPMQEVTQTALNGLADHLFSVVTTGKSNFKDFFSSILEMTAKASSQPLVAYSLQKTMDWLGIDTPIAQKPSKADVGDKPVSDSPANNVQPEMGKEEEQKKEQTNWLAGIKQGWEEYLHAATDVFASVEEISKTALSGLSDQLTSLVTTGKANFKDFSSSIINMIAGVISKLLVAYAVQQAMGWIGGGTSASFSSTRLSDGAAGIPMPPQFATSSYTGVGDKYQPAGIVHRGEFVFTQEATSRLGVSNLYRMMNGYAAAGLAGQGINVNTSVVVNASDDQQQVNDRGEQLAKAYQRTVDSSITEGIQRETRPGGIIWQAMKSR